MAYYGSVFGGAAGGMDDYGASTGVAGTSGGGDWMSMLGKVFGGGQKQQQPQQGGDQWQIPAQKASPNDMFNSAVSSYTSGLVKFGKNAGGGQARAAPKLPPPQPLYAPQAMEQPQGDALSRLLQVYGGGGG